MKARLCLNMRDRVMTDVQSLSAQMLHLQGVLKKFTKRVFVETNILKLAGRLKPTSRQPRCQTDREKIIRCDRRHMEPKIESVKQTNYRQKNRRAHRQTYRQTDSYTDILYIQTLERQTDRSQIVRLTERQTWNERGR